MNAIIQPGPLKGTIHISPSKSMMQRYYATAVLHRGTTIIRNVGRSEDDQVALRLIQQLGADVSNLSPNVLSIKSNGVVDISGMVDCGESGLSCRLFTIIAALSPHEVTITGSGSLLHRSMQPFEEIFSQLDIKMPGFSGGLPIQIRGPLIPKSIEIDGGLSSQFLTALLIVYAFTARKSVSISVKGLVSKPYVDLTLSILSRYGKYIANEHYQKFIVDPQQSEQIDLVAATVEGDWSSAAAWIAAGALNGDVALRGLDPQSTQADKRILEILKETGVYHEWRDGSLIVRSGPEQPDSFKFDATDCPDLFPVLSVYASLCKGESQITGLDRLYEKESDRAASIQSMLRSFNVPHESRGNTLVIEGRTKLVGGVVDSHRDHRIAMAATVGGLNAAGDTLIVGSESVGKSYKEFFKNLSALGGIYHQSSEQTITS